MHTVEPIVVAGERGLAGAATAAAVAAATAARSPLGWQPVEPKRIRPWIPGAVAIGVLAAVFLVGSFVQLPYYALAPGAARPVDSLIVARDTQTFPPRGHVLLTTITLSKASAFEAIAGWLRDDVDVLAEEDILPEDTTDEEFRQFNVAEMGDSKQTAVVVALRRLGYQVAEHGNGALVERALPEFPASGRLNPGEVIKAIDGRPVALVQDATSIIGSHRPGDVLDIEVLLPDRRTTRVVQVPVAADQDAGGKPVLGVFLRTFEHRFDLPFEVDIRSGSIGGPSAGLAFTLGLIDTLTPGELTGGRRVAATGTIEIDGRIGDVGGVAQKTAAVREAGADVFLVPAGEYEIAKQRAGSGIAVVKVSTLQEALDALEALGGDLSGLSAPAPVPPRGNG